MKKFINISFMFSLFLLGTMSKIYSQTNGLRTYRVIAYKSGSPEITSMSNETVVIPTMYIYVPNSFTPNGDGMNDTFGASGEAIKSFSMQIFNRWGDKIFESTSISKQWDGTYKGTKVPEGTYVYKVSASSLTNKNAIREGIVTLVN
jgi:gliding motility-associated-like protein